MRISPATTLRAAAAAGALPAAILASAALAACGDDARAGGALSRDSAGVRVITFAAAPANLRTGEPSLDVAGFETGGDFTLFRVTDALPLPDGGLVVANAGNGELLFFDHDGAFAARAGGAGDGPGEFRSIRWLASLPGDSLVAYDERARRASVFTAGHVFARLFSAAGQAADRAALAIAPDLLGVFPDGTFLAAAYGRPELVAGSARPPLRLLRVGPGEPAVDLGTWPGNELHLAEADGRFAVTVPLFARNLYAAAGGDDGFWVADGERWEVRRYDGGGALRLAVRRDHGGIAVTDAIVDAEIEAQLADIPEGPEREAAADRRRATIVATTAPAIAGLEVGEDGGVWVRDFTLAGAPARWTALDASGNPAGVVELPPGTEPLRFAAQDVIVVVTDAMGAERVRRYPLVPAPATTDASH